MQTPASPVYSDAGEFPMDVSPHHPGQQAHAHRRGANRIDYTKFKTKMCRHYLQGMCCPFRERCAFSHGDEEPTSPAVGGEYSEYADMMAGAEEVYNDDARSGNGSCGADQHVADLVPPPPAYEDVMMDDEDAFYAPSSAAAPPPPAYPTRYRFDPYSYTGICYY